MPTPLLFKNNNITNTKPIFTVCLFCSKKSLVVFFLCVYVPSLYRYADYPWSSSTAAGKNVFRKIKSLFLNLSFSGFVLFCFRASVFFILLFSMVHVLVVMIIKCYLKYNYETCFIRQYHQETCDKY